MEPARACSTPSCVARTLWEVSIPKLREFADSCPQLQRVLARVEKRLPGSPKGADCQRMEP